MQMIADLFARGRKRKSMKPTRVIVIGFKDAASVTSYQLPLNLSEQPAILDRIV